MKKKKRQVSKLLIFLSSLTIFLPVHAVHTVTSVLTEPTIETVNTPDILPPMKVIQFTGTIDADPPVRLGAYSGEME